MTKFNYTTLATDESIELTKVSLEKNGFNVLVAENGEEAKRLTLTLIPEGSEVMTATSKSLETLELDTYLNDSGKYNSVKTQLTKLDRKTDSLMMQKLGAAPEYVIGSVHAVTNDGKVMVASGSGSQLPSYSYGAMHVIWIVSTKKIVTNLDEAFDRVQTHVLPLEDQRIKRVYGPDAGSSPRKILIFNAESNPERITLILVKEDLGY